MCIIAFGLVVFFFYGTPEHMNEWISVYNTFSSVLFLLLVLLVQLRWVAFCFILLYFTLFFKSNIFKG